MYKQVITRQGNKLRHLSTTRSKNAKKFSWGVVIQSKNLVKYPEIPIILIRTPWKFPKIILFLKRISDTFEVTREMPLKFSEFDCELTSSYLKVQAWFTFQYLRVSILVSIPYTLSFIRILNFFRASIFLIFCYFEPGNIFQLFLQQKKRK